MDDVTVKTNQPVALPFPEEDYDKNGKLKKVRGRVLKKLLKYEFKSILSILFIPAIVILGVATYLFAFGFLIDFTSEDTTAKYVLWIMTWVLFVYGLLFMLIFPLIICMRRYSGNFFSSDGYLSLSIPATPEEQILAKRISQYIVMFATMLLLALSIFIAIFPAIRHSDWYKINIPAMNAGEWVVFILDNLHALLAVHIVPLFVVAVFSFLKCWRHRGLRPWMCVGLFFTLTYGAALWATLIEEGIIVMSKVFLLVTDWIFLVLQCVAIYAIWRYETNTLRNKINLK